MAVLIRTFIILNLISIQCLNSQILKWDDFTQKSSLNLISNNNINSIFSSNDLNLSVSIYSKIQLTNSLSYDYSGWYKKIPTQNEFFYRVGLNYIDTTKKIKPLFFYEFESSLNRNINHRLSKFFGLKYSFTKKSSVSFGFLWENAYYYNNNFYNFDRASLRLKINEEKNKNKILLEVFIQPVVSDFSNIRTRTNLVYSRKLNTKFDFNYNLSHSFESFNPMTIKKRSMLNTSVGFSINL